MAEVIGNDQAVDAPAVAQRATDKVQAPYLMTHVAATSGVRSPRYFLPMLLLRTAKPCSRQRRNTFFWLEPGNSPYRMSYTRRYPKRRHCVATCLDAFSQARRVYIGLLWMPPDIPGQPHKTSPPLRDLRGVPHLGDGLAFVLRGWRLRRASTLRAPRSRCTSASSFWSRMFSTSRPPTLTTQNQFTRISMT